MGYVLYGDGWGIPNLTKGMTNHDVDANRANAAEKEQCWNREQIYIYIGCENISGTTWRSKTFTSQNEY